jgi:hypothetical protein
MVLDSDSGAQDLASQGGSAKRFIGHKQITIPFSIHM